MSIPFVQLLSTAGDGTGTTEIIGDYSAAAETFELHGYSGSDGNMVVSRLLFTIEDATPMAATGFGSTTELTNGLDIAVTDSAGTGTIIQLTPANITRNADFAAIAYDVDVKAWSNGPEVLVCRWTFAKFAGGGGLNLNRGQKLVVTANDNLTALISFRITAQGTIPGDY